MRLLRYAAIAISTIGVGMGVATAQSGTISTTGPGSFNQVSFNQLINWLQQNFNNVGVTNSNSQTAVSGSANSSGNTIGGGAFSGSASNNNGASTFVSLSNSGG